MKIIRSTTYRALMADREILFTTVKENAALRAERDELREYINREDSLVEKWKTSYVDLVESNKVQ